MRHAVAAACIALLCVQLAGCGFHLRGQQPLPENWAQVAVRDVASRNPLGRGGDSWYESGREGMRRELVRALQEAGFTVDPQASLAIELLGTTVKRRAASIDATASAAEYQVDYAVRFRIVGSDGAQVVPESSISTDSSYRNNEGAVLGSAEQEVTVYEDLRRELARRIVDQLRRKAAAVPQAHATAP
ncbi:MAG: LPS assembly lipoprotein LptE [Pseudomonadota bacterium]